MAFAGNLAGIFGPVIEKWREQNGLWIGQDGLWMWTEHQPHVPGGWECVESGLVFLGRVYREIGTRVDGTQNVLKDGRMVSMTDHICLLVVADRTARMAVYHD
jgi:hypothetical protein